MKNTFAALTFSALLGLGTLVTMTEAADAAYVTTSVRTGPHGFTESRTVHTGYGRRTVRFSEGRFGHVCRSVVTVRRMPGRTVRTVRRVCR